MCSSDLPETVFSSIDAEGRYAYGNQPAIAQWNLARLGEALLPLIDTDRARAVDAATAVLARFADRIGAHWMAGMRVKLGLFTEEAGDERLARDLLAWMHDTRADYTNTFRMFATHGGPAARAGIDPVFGAWHRAWEARLARQPQDGVEVVALAQRSSPAVIPRNHRVEEALAAAEQGDLGPLTRLLVALAAPYDHGRAEAAFTDPPAVGAGPYRTFCGT